MSIYHLESYFDDLTVLYGTGDLKKPDNTAMYDALERAIDAIPIGQDGFFQTKLISKGNAQ